MSDGGEASGFDRFLRVTGAVGFFLVGWFVMAVALIALVDAKQDPDEVAKLGMVAISLAGGVGAAVLYWRKTDPTG